MISVHDLSFPLFQIYDSAQTLNDYMCIFIYIYTPYTHWYAWRLCTQHAYTKWNETFHRWIYYHLCGFFCYLFIYLFICMYIRTFDTLNSVCHFGSFQFTHVAFFPPFEMPIVDWCNTHFLFQSDFLLIRFVVADFFKFNQSNSTILAIRWNIESRAKAVQKTWLYVSWMQFIKISKSMCEKLKCLHGFW